MKTFAPSCATFIVLSFVLVNQALAGPLEDADAADKRADYVTALQLVSPLAQQGDAGAQRRMGIMYASGKGVPADYTEAEKWFQKAAAQGDLEAIWNIGYIHHRGLGNFKKDFAEGERWYLRAAELGHLGSQTALALAYGTVTASSAMIARRQNGTPEQPTKEISLLNLCWE